MADGERLSSRLSRRAFVGLVASGTFPVALAGLFHFTERRNGFIRPPGALAETEFLAVCIRCDKCRAVCPYDLIVPVPLTESVTNAGTPELVGYCPRCRLCIYACPVGALRNDRP